MAFSSHSIIASTKETHCSHYYYSPCSSCSTIDNPYTIA